MRMETLFSSVLHCRKWQWAQTGTQRFHLNIRKHFSTVQVMEHWNGLYTEVVKSLFLEMFKSHLGYTPGIHPLLKQRHLGVSRNPF